MKADSHARLKSASLAFLVFATHLVLVGCNRQPVGSAPRFELVDTTSWFRKPSDSAGYDLYLVHADGRRQKLSQGDTGPNGLLVTNSLAVWQEWEKVGEGVFEPIMSSTIMAADTSGRRADILGWLCARANKEFPTADPYSLLASDSPKNEQVVSAQPGSARPPLSWDPREGVGDFRPKAVMLKTKHPAVTFWCTVAAGRTYRPLAMRVPPTVILSYLAEDTNHSSITPPDPH